MENVESPVRESRSTRGSLRSRFLVSIGLLAAVALGSALWTIWSLLPSAITFEELSRTLILLVLEGALFLLLCNALLNRFLLRPLDGAVGVAEAISRGDRQRRMPEGRSRELQRLGESINRLADELSHNQQSFAANVDSLDATSRLLTEAQRELARSEKMASIGRLSAGVAHEIGNPLAALLGYNSVLRRRGTEPELVDGIEREARRIDRIVRDLLDYARPGTGQREPVDVNAAVQRVLTLLRSQHRLMEVEQKLTLAVGLPTIDANPHRFDQMLLNLFVNADDSMNGRGLLSVDTRVEPYRPDRPLPRRRADDPAGIDYSHLRRPRNEAVHDSGALRAGAPVIRLVIADSGPGIAPEHLDAVFEPFFTTRQPGEGTGLGLAIVAGTVAELGGRIDLSSAPEGGATFRIYLPVGLE